MVEPVDDGVGDLLGMIGDDLEPDGAAAVFHHFVGNGGGGEAVKDAQSNRLEIVNYTAVSTHLIINKIGNTIK